jgi:hypothetical protein
LPFRAVLIWAANSSGLFPDRLEARLRALASGHGRSLTASALPTFGR